MGKGAFMHRIHKNYGGVTMSNVREAKEQLVDVISDQLKNSVSTVLI